MSPTIESAKCPSLKGNPPPLNEVRKREYCKLAVLDDVLLELSQAFKFSVCDLKLAVCFVSSTAGADSRLVSARVVRSFKSDYTRLYKAFIKSGEF